VSDVAPEFFNHAQRVQELLSHNLSEADTRVRLIDPLLAILGYGSVTDLRREVPIPASREFVDYVLRVDEHPYVVVEAKALRHVITDQDAAQCIGYASVLGAPWCLVTNGLSWQLLYAYATGPLASKRIAQVRIDADDRSLAEAWRVLSLIGKDSLTHPNPLANLLIERVVIDELNRPDSAAIQALRRVVRERFREQVSAQAVIDAIERLRGPEAVQGTAEVGVVPEAGITPPARNRRQREVKSTSLSQLVAGGLLPPDASLECKLYGVTHVARLRDGRIEVNGISYDSPSAAAAALRDGKASNGWVIWKYKGEFLADLRARIPAQPKVEAN
jgi:predicted type IV restriction endonuclease